MERHELGGQAIGIILHGLHAGTQANPGRLLPLEEHLSTEAFAVDVAEYRATPPSRPA